MNQATQTKYKRDDEAFKRQAVEHWLVSGLPDRQIAPTVDAFQAENRRLQRELRRAQ